MFYLTTHSTHFIYGYMASDIWLRTILIVRKEICCRHIGYSFRLTARVLLYAPSHRQDSTYHSLCYTSRGALAGMIIGRVPSDGQSVTDQQQSRARCSSMVDHLITVQLVIRLILHGGPIELFLILASAVVLSCLWCGAYKKISYR